MQLKTKRTKTGFTLIELLVVIMIMGIILGICIPAVVNLQKSQNAKKFEYFTTIVEEAADLYVEQYGKSFDEAENCFDIPYDLLVEEELIQESDITCLSSEGQQGIVQATRVPGTNHFTYEYFLTCMDTTTGEVLHESGAVPTGCKGVNGNFIVNIDSAVKVVDGVTSDYTFDTWTRGKVVVTLSAVNPYFYEIDHYEYSLDGSNYDRITGNQITFEVSLNRKVYFRAFDSNGNMSGDTVAIIKIDNDLPSANIQINGTKGSNGWYVSNITTNCENESDGSGSGVASCSVSPSSVNQETKSTVLTMKITDYVGNTQTKSTTVKIDKNAPSSFSVTLKKADGSAYTSGSTSNQDVKISVTAQDSYSGVNQYLYSSDNGSTWKRVPSNWTVTDNGSYSFVVKAMDNAGNVTKQAKFTIVITKTVQVKYDATGGNVNPSSKIVTFGKAYGTLAVPSKTGYDFVGWFTSPSGGTQITSATIVNNANTHTLYARWNQKKYTLYFNANGGSVSPSNRSITYGSTYGSLPTPSKTGYDFAGWYTSASGGSKVSSSTKMGAGNTTIYAHWSKKYYTLSFDSTGGTSVGNRSVGYGDSYGNLPTPTRQGYSFTGWYTSASGGSKVSSSTKMGAGNVKLYAHWSMLANTSPFSYSFGLTQTQWTSAPGQYGDYGFYTFYTSPSVGDWSNYPYIHMSYCYVNDTINEGGGDHAVRLEGSNDQSNWTVLHEYVTNTSGPNKGRNRKANTFFYNNSSKYKYFRITYSQLSYHNSGAIVGTHGMLVGSSSSNRPGNLVVQNQSDCENWNTYWWET